MVQPETLIQQLRNRQERPSAHTLAFSKSAIIFVVTFLHFYIFLLHFFAIFSQESNKTEIFSHTHAQLGSPCTFVSLNTNL